MSYLTQMLALTVQNFVSAATGMAVLAAFIRGFGRRSAETIGNFWVDMTRTDALHPPAALLRLRAGPRVPGRRADVRSLREGRRRAADELRRADHRQGRQARARREGPAEDEEGDADRAGHRRRPRRLADRDQAARDERRRLFNVNSAHPFENPTPLTNFLELLAILQISARSATRSASWSATRGRAGRCSRP